MEKHQPANKPWKEFPRPPATGASSLRKAHTRDIPDSGTDTDIDKYKTQRRSKMYRNPANAPDPSRESPAFEGITRLRTNEPQGDPAGIDVAGTVEPNKISGTTEDLKQPKTRQTKQTL